VPAIAMIPRGDDRTDHPGQLTGCAGNARRNTDRSHIAPSQGWFGTPDGVEPHVIEPSWLSFARDSGCRLVMASPLYLMR
jgi:hypothetical protein